MKITLYTTFFILALWSCGENAEPEAIENPSQLTDYSVQIDEIHFANTKLENGRTGQLEQYYFLIGVFEYQEKEDEDEEKTTNPYTTTHQYASGGFNQIPENLKLSLFSNKKYIIQSLVLKKSNGFGIATAKFEHGGIEYDRLYLGYDGNQPLPAIICDSMAYSNPWLTTNSGLLLFNDGYMYENKDSTDVVYRGPLLMNSYYESKIIYTNSELDEITLEPRRSVFGVQVNVDGLTDNNYLEIQIGYSFTTPIKVSKENNGEIFVFPLHTYESDAAIFPLFKVSSIHIDANGNHISKVLHIKEYQEFPKLTKTVLDVSIGNSNGREITSNISLIEEILATGSTIEITD